MPFLAGVYGGVLAHCVGGLLAHVAIRAHEIIKIIITELSIAADHGAELL